MAKKSSISIKRKFSAFLKENSTPESVPWVEEFTPLRADDLAVHKKKVSEVQAWFQKFLSNVGGEKVAPILLLTGPPGVGKTATVMTLCHSINAEVHVWSNTHQEKWNSNDVHPFSTKDRSLENENQTTAFSRFLLHSTKYSLVTNSSKVIVVEEIPNALVRNPDDFHTIIRKYCFMGRYPLVVIISDNTKGDSTENRLFPKDLQLSLKIDNISFNAVAPTMMMKVLNRINMSSKVESVYKRLNKAQLEIIAADSKGDIRNAINTMQFLCMTQSVSPPVPKKKDQGSKVEKSRDCVLKRDSSLFLFHALGKILYCKREPWLKSEKDTLPENMKYLERDPLVEDAEDVYEKTSISAEGFNLFLQENYLPFIEDTNVATECSKWLSEADALSSLWDTRETMNDYSVSLATRGLMFNLVPCNIAGRRWRSLHKPQYYECNSKKNSLAYSLKQAFKGTSVSMRELQIDVIPFVSKFHSIGLSPAQVSLAKEVGVMNVKRSTRTIFRSSALDEKECFVAETDSAQLEADTAANPAEKKCFDADIQISDEEIIIEEYDF